VKPQTWKDYRGNGKPNVAERNRRISVGLRLAAECQLEAEGGEPT